MTKNGEWWLALRPVVKPKSGRADIQSAATIALGTVGRGG
jgi:hypothetical protein